MADEAVKEHVIFAGQLNADDLRNWYAASDLVVLPSREEGLPRVLLEAQAMCRPAVAYAVGGVTTAIRDSITGYIVPKADPRYLARSVRILLQDSDKRIAMGKKGRDWIVGQFSLDALATRHEAFYRAAVSPAVQPNSGRTAGSEL